MKKVISGKELQEKMKEAISLLCDTVANTLGPVGNNVLISNSSISPFITNDGVTIAENIESEESAANTILEIAKEAALKTNEIVGDGTTTTLVLLKYFFFEGLKEIEKGKSGITLKKEWQKDIRILLEKLKEVARTPEEKDFIHIASNSANDKELGEFLWKSYKMVEGKSAIRLEESNNENTYFELKKGYEIEINTMPDFILENKEEIELQNAKILVIKGELLSIEQISNIINECILRKETLILLAENISEEIKQSIFIITKQENCNIYFIEIPDYASRKNEVLNDIAIISNAIIEEIELKQPEWTNLGKVKNLKIKKTTAIFGVEETEKIIKYTKILKRKLEKTEEEYEREFLEERLAKIQKGIGIIFVGGITKTEKREKLSRIEDAINAIEIAKQGIVVGEGLTYFRIANEIENISPIMASVLEKPLKTILENAGCDSQKIMEGIKRKKFQAIYNIEKETLEKIQNSTIIDPLKVVCYALENAISIASMLLTTNSIVINDTINKKEIEI